MSRITYNEISEFQSSNSNSIGFFSLKNDGDEAVVRILHDSVETFDLVNTHDIVLSDGKTRKIDCLRSLRDPLDVCPLCNAGYKTIQRFYIHLLQYDKDPTTGQITVLPKLWERSVSYATTISNLINEYGPLSDHVFKIRRNGAHGDKNTTYTIMFGNPSVYKEEYYPKEYSSFDNYSVIGQLILSKTADEINRFLVTGTFDVEETKSASAPVTNAIPVTPTTYNRGTVPVAGAVDGISRPQRFY